MSAADLHPHRSRRILVTGLSTYWGGRLAQALEAFDEVEAIIGVDVADPTHELERTEFVRVGNQHSLIQRIVQAAEIDTVVDTRLVVDSLTTSPRLAHENNVIGTMNILAACTGADSPVRKFIFKSSGHYYGCEQDDPAFFTEEMARPHPPSTALERDIVEAEASVAEFAEKHPETIVTVMRFANVLGPDVNTSHVRLFSLPLVPMILGFDPRYQFVHEDDVVHALEHATLADQPGIFNVAADGVLALSEVIDLLGKHPLPILPPWGTGIFTAPLRRLGFRIPDEMLNQLRFGRALDNRKYKLAGFDYKYTTRETVVKQREHARLSAVVRGAREPYRYEQEVEEFLRWSPHVRRAADAEDIGGVTRKQLVEVERVLRGHADPAPGSAGRVSRSSGAAPEQTGAKPAAATEEQMVHEAPKDPGEHADAAPIVDYDDLETEEVIALLAGLDRAELEAIERYERQGRARAPVIDAVERVLTRAG